MNALHQWVDAVQQTWEIPGIRALLILAVFFLVAMVVWMFSGLLFRTLANKLELEGAGVLGKRIRLPVTFTILVLGTLESVAVLPIPSGGVFALSGVLLSATVFVWMVSIRRIVVTFIREKSNRRGAGTVLNRRTMPVALLVSQGVIYAVAVYFLFRSWGVDATAWLASAGILGVAIGFAAQNSLADVLAGVSILIDPPFQVGDFVRVEKDYAGRVKKIGLRTTRVVTLDGVEVVLPNSLVNGKLVVNTSEGLREGERVQLDVCLEYGADVEKQTEALVAACSLESVRTSPAPCIHVRELGDFGVTFRLFFWVERSEDVEPARDQVNRAILRELEVRDLHIPFPRMDVVMGGSSPSASRGK